MSVPVVDTVLLRALRADFEASTFTVDAVSDLLGEAAHAALHREQRVPALRRARHSQSTLATVIRLFVLGDEVATAQVEAAFAQTTVPGLRQLGLIEGDDFLRATVQIQPHEATFTDQVTRWWVASDLGEALSGEAPGNDHVLGIGGATRTLLNLTPRTRVKTALDLGTGCGILALYLAQHADRVVATDLSVRACEFARFNAALNEAHIEVCEGSLFEPVAGEQFDLIVSNPPFVITPDTLRDAGLVTYRDAGQAGDTLVADVLHGAIEHLTTHGRAFILGNWEVTTGQDWDDHPRAWLTNQPAHAWVIERESLAASEYIEMWMRDNATVLTRTPKQREADYSAWLDDFASRSVLNIGLGIIALQKTANTAHQRFSAIVSSTSANGSYLDRVLSDLAEHNWRADEEDVFVRASDVREERHYEPGEPDPQIIIATQGDGFGQRLQLDTDTAAALGVCDGELTLGQTITAISVVTGRDREHVAQAVIGRFPDLIAAGMVRRI
ncbi:MAG: methyltransferase [Actinomycetaceae bacterium]|nr:methyltransferase [Actinomycetaceae bacterium]